MPEGTALQKNKEKVLKTTVDTTLNNVFSTLLSNLMYDSSFSQLIMYMHCGEALLSSHGSEISPSAYLFEAHEFHHADSKVPL